MMSIKCEGKIYHKQATTAINVVFACALISAFIRARFLFMIEGFMIEGTNQRMFIWMSDLKVLIYFSWGNSLCIRAAWTIFQSMSFSIKHLLWRIAMRSSTWVKFYITHNNSSFWRPKKIFSFCRSLFLEALVL